MENLFTPILLIAGILLVYILIIRAIFSIPQFLRYKKAELKLLALIAEKSGASENLIKEIVFESNPTFKKDEHFQEDEDPNASELNIIEKFK
jgi:uncharacterized membrane protein